MSYTKLFASILDSTIWSESPAIKLVWITMLAMADKNGEVMASVPGLAKRAGVPLEECQEALQKFLSPDPFSRTPDDEGRRIEVIDGGWSLLNHAKYREMASKEDQKNAAAIRQRRFRAKQARNTKVVIPSGSTVTISNAGVTHGDAPVTQDRDIADTEADTEISPKGEIVYMPESPPPAVGEAPVPLETVMKNCGQWGILPKVAQRWWLTRDGQGWDIKGKWLSNLKSYALTWVDNEKRREMESKGPSKPPVTQTAIQKQRQELADARFEELSRREQENAASELEKWNARAAWRKADPATRSPIPPFATEDEIIHYGGIVEA